MAPRSTNKSTFPASLEHAPSLVCKSIQSLAEPSTFCSSNPHSKSLQSSSYISPPHLKLQTRPASTRQGRGRASVGGTFLRRQGSCSGAAAVAGSAPLAWIHNCRIQRGTIDRPNKIPNTTSPLLANRPQSKINSEISAGRQNEMGVARHIQRKTKISQKDLTTDSPNLRLATTLRTSSLTPLPPSTDNPHSSLTTCATPSHDPLPPLPPRQTLQRPATLLPATPDPTRLHVVRGFL